MLFKRIGGSLSNNTLNWKPNYPKSDFYIPVHYSNSIFKTTSFQRCSKLSINHYLQRCLNRILFDLAECGNLVDRH